MLEFKNVCVSVSKTPILKDISVIFEEGKITSIVGPNGSGKTTLLQTLNGISTVTAGKIMIDGESYLDFSVRERAKRLSFMPQFRESAPSISVKGLVEHGRFPYMGFSRMMNADDRAAVEHALEYVQLLEYRDCMVNELSGGLQQRVYLAMQLAQNSPYMVLDEPMNYLDFPSQRQMYRLITSLKDEGKTIILVLHDLNRALQISDNVVVMKDRRIRGCKSPKECIESGLIEEVFECRVDCIDTNGVSQYIFT